MTPQQILQLTNNPLKTNTSGIYMILCPVTNKVFMGSARSIIRRWYTHTYELKNQNHEVEHLQEMYQKYGKGAVVFFVLENCSKDDLANRLESWIDLLDKEYKLDK